MADMFLEEWDFWVLMLCSFDKAHYFRGTCCMTLSMTLKMEVAWSSETWRFLETTQCYNFVVTDIQTSTPTC